MILGNKLRRKLKELHWLNHKIAVESNYRVRDELILWRKEVKEEIEAIKKEQINE